MATKATQPSGFQILVLRTQRMKSWITEGEVYGKVFYHSGPKRKKIEQVPIEVRGPWAATDGHCLGVYRASLVEGQAVQRRSHVSRCQHF